MLSEEQKVMQIQNQTDKLGVALGRFFLRCYMQGWSNVAKFTKVLSSPYFEVKHALVRQCVLTGCLFRWIWSKLMSQKPKSNKSSPSNIKICALSVSNYPTLQSNESRVLENSSTSAECLASFAWAPSSGYEPLHPSAIYWITGNGPASLTVLRRKPPVIPKLRWSC